MMYVEFIERDRLIPIEIFRYLGDQQASWVDAEADRMVLQLGRTLRLGPFPSYLAFWRIGTFARLDEWDAYFSSDAWFRNRRSQAMHRAIHMQHAGLYDELLVQESGEDQLYYLEYLATDLGTGNEALIDEYQRREAEQERARLLLLLRRIGWLGPAPGDLALWCFPSYGAAEPFVRRRPQDSRVRIETVGFYRKLGAETL